MSFFRTTALSISFCLGLNFAGPGWRASAEAAEVKYPALISANSRTFSPGKGTLPFLISLAKSPQLLQPPYLRIVFGTPDRARAYAYPSNTFAWTPDDGSRAHFVLSRNTDSRPPVGGETRRLVTNFKQSSISLKDVRARLGKPLRRYYDNGNGNGTRLVELYQITPETTLAACELPNSFDVSEISVSYSGTYLPPVTEQEQAQAESFRLKQINHHLSHGNRVRGLQLLQEYVSDNPKDIKGHLSLASALRHKCDVNGSFAEYRQALALAQTAGDVSLQKQAIKGLYPCGPVPTNLSIVRTSSKNAAPSTASASGSAPGVGASAGASAGAPVRPALTAVRGGGTPQ